MHSSAAAGEPAPWQRWTREDVAQWLEGFGLAKYKQVQHLFARFIVRLVPILASYLARPHADLLS